MVTVSAREVRTHYDLLSVLYHFFWGEHIHHGYWYGQEPAREAQVNLVRLLSERAGVERGMRVLDVGCGVGGSSLWLARRGCEVTGITLSPVQAVMARLKARQRGIRNASFRVFDANYLGGLEETFDCIWVIECSEHLADRARFFRQCYTLLRPGGRLALCSWLRGEREWAAPEMLEEIYGAMVSPPLLGGDELVGLLEEAGFAAIRFEDITSRVKPTWDHCLEISRRPLFRGLLPVMGSKVGRFVRSFELMKAAYEQGIMAYGMVTAEKEIRRVQKPRGQCGFAI